MGDELQVGIITSTHGIKGEVKVFPTTDDAERFLELKEVILDTGKERITLEICGVKFFKQYVILKFKGIDDINQVEKYLKKPLLVTRDQAVKLKKDEYFVADLIGMRVLLEDNSIFGELTDVLSTGANDVYEVTMTDGKQVLIPAIKQCIIAIDLPMKTITVHLLEGLM